MATRKLYWEDPYMRGCRGRVLSIEGNGVITDRTCFNPRGGGLVSDTGTMAGQPVLEAIKRDEDIVHILSGPPSFGVGDEVDMVLDWGRRYKIMRMHTATHILSNVVNRETGALITGNSVTPEEARVDFSLETFDRSKMEEHIAMVNEVISRDLQVRAYFMRRDEALKMPGMVKLAEALPPAVDELRIVEIGDFDRQADGGVHVARTSEIGRVCFLKAENKGRTNRRVYFTLE